MRRRFRTEEDTGDLNIVPYLDIVVNLVMFMLLSMTGLISFGVLNVSAPKIGGEAAVAGETAPRLLLTVAIGKDGFYVAGAGGVLGADAAAGAAGRPPSIPLVEGRYDYAALTAELVRVKDRFPSETQVILSADPDVPYDVLIQTMDACRETAAPGPGGATERRPLFFDVSLSLVG
jgi:biopolymer transport protein ExbD